MEARTLLICGCMRVRALLESPRFLAETIHRTVLALPLSHRTPYIGQYIYKGLVFFTGWFAAPPLGRVRPLFGGGRGLCTLCLADYYLPNVCLSWLIPRYGRGQCRKPVTVYGVVACGNIATDF